MHNIKKPTILVALVLASLPDLGLAQQNLFNVPSTDITQEGQFFFQEQFNFLTGSVASSNTTLDYGLGHQLEIGINLFNLDFQATKGTFENPHLLFNFQKGFTITDNYKVSFGTQTGFTPPLHNKTIVVPSLSYIDNALDLKDWGKYYLGGYYTNRAYANKNEVGYMVGMEFPLIENKLHFMSDFISGKSAISVAVVGFVLFLPYQWQLSLGAQLPAPHSNNDYGMVFEITKL